LHHVILLPPFLFSILICYEFTPPATAPNT
jgi:hypothetical protein